MKPWMIFAPLLLFVVLISSLAYLLSRGLNLTGPWLLLIWLFVFGIFAAFGGIAWRIGWLPRKKKS